MEQQQGTHNSGSSEPQPHSSPGTSIATSDGAQSKLGSNDEANCVSENLRDHVPMLPPPTQAKTEELNKLFEVMVRTFIRNQDFGDAELFQPPSVDVELDRLLPVGCVISRANMENVNLFDAHPKTGDTIAHKMCSGSSPQEYHNFVELMVKLERGDIFSVQNRWRNTAIHEAFDRKLCLLPSTVRLLGDKCKFTFNTRDMFGNTELLLASISAPKEVLETMVQYVPSVETANDIVNGGAGVHSINHDRRSVLHLASLGGNLEAVKYFISKGADVHAEDKHGQTPLLCCVIADGVSGIDYLEIIKILTRHGGNLDAVSHTVSNVIMLVTCARTAREELEKKLNIGNELKEVFQYHLSILFQLARKGNVEVLKYFISIGIEGKNIARQMPLHVAKNPKQNFIEIVSSLVEAGADVNEVDRDGDNFILAVSRGRGRTLEELKHLVSLGADWRRKNKEGDGILHHLIYAQNGDAHRYFMSLMMMSENEMN